MFAVKANVYYIFVGFSMVEILQLEFAIVERYFLYGYNKIISVVQFAFDIAKDKS